jgi:hypothetical protein
MTLSLRAGRGTLAGSSGFSTGHARHLPKPQERRIAMARGLLQWALERRKAASGQRSQETSWILNVRLS